MPKRNSRTPTGTWCIIGLVAVIAILALIFGAMSFSALRQMQNQQASSFGGKWEVKNNKLVTGENTVIINTASEDQEGVMNGHFVSTDDGAISGLYFSNQETLKTDAGFEVSNKNGAPSLSIGIYKNSSLGEKNFNKGKPPKPPACDTSPAITVDSEPGECPRSFVGINNKDPECHLHVNETMCVEGETLFKGNVTIDGILFITAIKNCNNDAECEDTDDCTTDLCIDNVCTNELPDGHCNADHFCTANEICELGDCVCAEWCIQSQCNTHPCEVRACIDGVCTLLHRDIGCCIGEGTGPCGSEDTNLCTIHSCINNKCVEQQRPFGCSHDTDCESDQICNQQCQCVTIEPTSDECEGDIHCEDDCACTLDFCSNGKCINLHLPGCCKNDTDCQDSESCHENSSCDLITGLCSHIIKDSDQDQVPCGIDCNDDDDTIGTAPTWYRDEDGDGDGRRADKRVECFKPTGFVETGTDCDDDNPFVFSGSVVCNFTDFSNQFELASNPIDNDFSSAGFSVSVHNDKMIIGAPGTLFPLRGAAIILKRYADNLWVEEAFLEEALPINNNLGFEVKIYNDIAIVLCPDCLLFALPFPIIIYKFDGTWLLDQRLSLPIGNDMNFQIDLLDEKILVAASNITLDSSQIFVYAKNQTTANWELTQTINSDGEITDIAFDKNDSDYFTFGAREFGSIRIFKVYLFTGGSYVQIAADITGDVDELNFGESVDFHNGVVVVGSPSPNNTNFREKIFVYEVSGMNVSFVQFVRPRYVSGFNLEFSRCGTSIAIYDDLIVVGCPNERVDQNRQGAVNIFKLINSSYRWIARMIPPSLESFEPPLYGQSVDVDNGTIVSGAPGIDATTSSHINDGNVYTNRCNEIRTC